MRQVPEMTEIRRESEIEKKVTQGALAAGWRQRKMAFVGRRGCPDRWFFKAPGRLVIVEFKDPNGELSYHQSKEVGWLKKNGFDVHVIDSIAAGLALFEG